MEAEAKMQMTSEAIAFTEKKIGMSLDDIVKMSKKSKPNNRRVSNKSRRSFNTGTAQKNSFKVRQYMDSRSSVRQGALAKRRSNFNGNQFPLTTGVAKKAASAPFTNRAFNGNGMANKSSKGRGPTVAKKKFTGRNFDGKQWQQKTGAVRKPRTLDERFANLKQHRMKVLSGPNDK